MVDTEPELQALMRGVRADAKQRFARWDDGVFARAVSWQAGYVWRTLKKHPAKVRDRSVLIYLHAVASGIGNGYIAADGTRTLMEFFLCNMMPAWLATSPPKSHANIVATAWNLAEGAHREASWLEQYLIARVHEFRSHPTTLEQKAADLLKPVLEPQSDAAWKGPFQVTVVDLRTRTMGFLPGEISMVTPSLVRVGDRRDKTAVGVLLARGKPECIGSMPGITAAAPAAPAVTVAWRHDGVTVGDNLVPIPLMGCVPLHTLALANGFLLAVLPNSQRLWVVETP